MKIQNTQQQETSFGQVKEGNTGKGLPRTGLGFGIITICLMISSCTSISRPSTASEIAAEKEFQCKFQLALEEFHQKMATVTKEAEQNSDSILKATLDTQNKFQDKLQTAQEEFQQKVDAASKEAKQKADSFGK